MRKTKVILACIVGLMISGCVNKSSIENFFKESSFIPLNRKIKEYEKINTIEKNNYNTENIQDNQNTNTQNHQNNSFNKKQEIKIIFQQPKIKIEDNSVIKDDKEFHFKIEKIKKKKINTQKIKLNKVKKIDILNK